MQPLSRDEHNMYQVPKAIISSSQLIDNYRTSLRKLEPFFSVWSCAVRSLCAIVGLGPPTPTIEAPSRTYGGASHDMGIGIFMRTAKRPRRNLPPTTDKYRPEDLEAMRQAFICACHEHPDLSGTEAQRDDLADAMVSVYRKHLTQQEGWIIPLAFPATQPERY